MKTVALLIQLVVLATLTACSTLKPTDDTAVQSSADPIAGFNRAMHRFNTAADKAVLRPVAKGYDKVLPDPAKRGIGNFFDNLNEPLNALNNLLQGKLDRTLSSTFRFVVNSTFGLAGLFDVADRMQVAEAKEDFGQTLGAWGVKPGPYLVLPLLGPSNFRDGLGLVVESVSYYPNGEITDSSGGRIALSVLDVVDTRASLLGTDKLLDAQIDPYGFLKSSYEQNRVNLLYDGSPPISEEELELDF